MGNDIKALFVVIQNICSIFIRHSHVNSHIVNTADILVLLCLVVKNPGWFFAFKTQFKLKYTPFKQI